MTLLPGLSGIKLVGTEVDADDVGTDVVVEVGLELAGAETDGGGGGGGSDERAVDDEDDAIEGGADDDEPAVSCVASHFENPLCAVEANK